ncbi:RNA-binding protein [Streptohalobacillus salinus]|uniref:RNA-binding protein n=1 Tax=Streptohalobacillus salinus TaxID=621096 RepID=A0A2V3WS97_9BACI|nr:ribosome assembly RNA-binding protein YhbY [Streptohalobacillus salinus]PXW91599.1 RNA-binding protein [Streptohalobacillus salinus]
MLTGKQKRYLRKTSHPLRPIFQVGKEGVNENMLIQINEALEKRELIKVNVLQNCPEDKDDVKEAILEGTEAELVQMLGNVITLYKLSAENKTIQLP